MTKDLPETITSLSDGAFYLLSATIARLDEAESALAGLNDRLFAEASITPSGETEPKDVLPLGVANNLLYQLGRQFRRADRLAALARSLSARI
jgi:hypothetical protein